jgi:hypothetical protein
VPRLPADAFDRYAAMGLTRSYDALAKACGVTKGAVTKRATKEGWQKRLTTIETTARNRSDDKLVESIEQMNERHLKTLRVMSGKALQALQAMPLHSAMDAIRALDMCIKQERTIRGEPGERSAVSMEQLVRSEYERWMTPAPGDANGHDTAAGDQ